MNELTALSHQLASVVETLAPSIVRVNDGSRLTATGLIWSSDGLILATSHGVERDDELSVQRRDGSRHAATLLGRDTDTDLALLRVQASDLPVAPRAEADSAKVGQLVLALGQPGEMGLRATLGIISARLESEREGRAEHILHTDADLLPGFSGGPLVSVDGRVVGLLNRAFGRGAGVALGVPVLENAVATLQSARVRPGYLGVTTQAVLLPESLRREVASNQKRALLSTLR